MKYSFFEIENFKGIEKIKIDLEKSPKSNIYTLVGLNESGKTTVLEAINSFKYKTETLEALELPGYTIDDIHDLIPISKRDNFNQNIIITVELVFEDNDEQLLANFLRQNHKFKLSKKIEKFTISQKLIFKDSKYGRFNHEVQQGKLLQVVF